MIRLVTFIFVTNNRLAAMASPCTVQPALQLSLPDFKCEFGRANTMWSLNYSLCQMHHKNRLK
jgi:hypothetical protein